MYLFEYYTYIYIYIYRQKYVEIYSHHMQTTKAEAIIQIKKLQLDGTSISGHIGAHVSANIDWTE